MNGHHYRRHGMIALGLACTLLLSQRAARSEECNPVSQTAVDACNLGCTAAGGLCEYACNAGLALCRDGCTGVYNGCELGCDACELGCSACCCDSIVCDACSCSGCLEDLGCDTCSSDCSSDRSTCNAGCDGSCDACKLDCDCDSLCVPYKKLGETCIPGVEPCASGLVCWPASFTEDDVFQCFPDETDQIWSDEACLAMYSSELHDFAMSTNTTYSYGSGGSGSVGISDVVEFGAVYGRDGCYGCYASSCIGAESNVQASIFATIGGWDTDINGFKGQSLLQVTSAGVELISFAYGLVFPPPPPAAPPFGTTSTLSFGVGIVPISAGLYDCQAVINKVYCLEGEELVENVNSPPIAQCQGVETCGDPCESFADVDGGSSDPDGDEITLTQSPPGPYPLGDTTVTLTVTDAFGESDSCQTVVHVTDCTPPEITCPGGTSIECDQSAVPATTGTASAVDSCDPGPLSIGFQDATAPGDCPQEETISRTWTATDASGNSSQCVQTIDVIDTTAPVVSCGAEQITVRCDEDVPPFEPTVTDNCDPNPEGIAASTISPTSCPADAVQYYIDRSYSAMDGCGNDAGCGQEVVVLKRTLQVDIKPGSCPNGYNPGSRGLLPVSLVGTADFDVTQVDLSSLRISRADCEGGTVAPEETTYEDAATPFDGELCDCHELTSDGVLDLSMKFSRTALASTLLLDTMSPGEPVELVISGALNNGCEFIASDCVTWRPGRQGR